MEKLNKRANGEGSLYFEEKRKYWRATITLPDGKRKDFCSKSKNIAIKKRNEFIRNNYKTFEFSEKTIIYCCEKYLEILFNQQRFGESTYRTHLETLKRIKKSNLANLSISSISIDDINEFLTQEIQKGLCKSILKKDKSMLKWGFKYAIEMRLIEENPMDSIFLEKALPKERKKIRALTSKEQKNFFAALQNYNEKPYSDIWLFAIFTGLRTGEICALTYDDIDFENRVIYIKRTLTRDILGRYVIGNATKTQNSRRIIQFSDNVAKLLDNIKKIKKDNTSLLFSDNFGNFVNPTRIAEKLREFNKIYNISDRLTMHMFRHTYATRLIEQNIPAYAVQHLLGHSSIDITLDTYTDFFEAQEEKYTNEIDKYWSSAINN